MELSRYQKLEYIRQVLNIIVDKVVVDKPSGFLYIEKVFSEDSVDYNEWARRIGQEQGLKLILTSIRDMDNNGFALEWRGSEPAAKVTARAIVNFLDSELGIKDPMSLYDIDLTYARLVELSKYSDEELSLYLKLKENSGLVRQALK